MNSGTRAPVLPQFSWVGTVQKTPSFLKGVLGARNYLNLTSAYGWLKHETRSRADIPLRQRLRTWQRGFFAESAALYDLERNNPDEYLSDFTRATRCREINPHNEFFVHKMVLRSFLLAMGFRQPETVALLFRGQILSDPYGSNSRDIKPEELEDRLRASSRDHIVKPEGSASDGDVFLLQKRDGGFIRRRGTESLPFDLGAMLQQSKIGRALRDMTLIEERLAQAPFWDQLFPESANTIRLLTLWTPGEPTPFIARAVQRIGTAETVPTDSWSRGGISAPVDLVSGTLGQGKLHPSRASQRMAGQPLNHHPETGAQIGGATIPQWDQVKETVLRAAASLPFNPMAAWDVLVAPDGVPVILQASGDTDLHLLQVHGGLLADPRIRRFYQEVGALGR